MKGENQATGSNELTANPLLLRTGRERRAISTAYRSPPQSTTFDST